MYVIKLDICIKKEFFKYIFYILYCVVQTKQYYIDNVKIAVNYDFLDVQLFLFLLYN